MECPFRRHRRREDQDLCQQSRGRPWLINTANGKVKRGVHQKIIGTKPDHLKKAWKSNCKDAKWTEEMRDLEYLQEVIYDKNTTWHKSMKETLKRDNDRLVTMETAAKDEEEEYKGKVALEQRECQLRKEEEEAVEAKQLLKEMLRNVENADARVERTRQRFSEEFDSCLNRWLREEGPVGFLSLQTDGKSQSSDTKSWNTEKDLNDIFRRCTENDG